MAKFDRDERFTVLNEYPHSVGFPVVIGEMIMLEPARDGIPSMTIVRFDDILLAHTKSNIIHNGTVFFEPEVQSSIYAELRIDDWKNIWHRDDIKHILLNPTAETLQQIVSIKDAALFDRIRGVYVGLVNAGYDVPQKTSAVIENRYHEWQDGIITSKITIVKKESDNEESQYKELENKIAQLEARLNSGSPSDDTKPEVQTPASIQSDSASAASTQGAAPAPKKRGRPAKVK